MDQVEIFQKKGHSSEVVKSLLRALNKDLHFPRWLINLRVPTVSTQWDFGWIFEDGLLTHNWEVLLCHLLAFTDVKKTLLCQCYLSNKSKEKWKWLDLFFPRKSLFSKIMSLEVEERQSHRKCIWGKWLCCTLLVPSSQPIVLTSWNAKNLKFCQTSIFSLSPLIHRIRGCFYFAK